MEETISLRQLFNVLKKRIIFIVLGSILGVVISGTIAFFILVPRYESRAQLIVTLPHSEITNVNDVNNNLQMINTYKDIITGDLVINEVSEKLKSDYNVKISSSELRNDIRVEQNQDSQMFSIITTNENARKATQITNTTAKIFKKNAKDVLNIDRISIISNATINNKPIFPNKKIMLLLGLVVGTLIGIFLTIVTEVLDRTIKEAQILTDGYGLTILGTIPQMKKNESNMTLKNQVTDFSIEKNIRQTDNERPNRIERNRV
ncbi:YveK family protein [Enterococcus pseudoavium]|uniref:YveK family protein n=1 Tax=Enterococcus pseudoavium TaxID=44007 RepID=UPI0008345721|nr:Wzz/FepE/Etk N-terminal domain-containing protein [Enterococcus pseudoavium]REC32406.1 tyrosine protein kinase [Enterococcus pseudoavium]